MKKTIRTGIAAGVAALALTGGGAAFAASTSTAPNVPAPVVHKVCDQFGVNIMHLDYNGKACPSGYYQTAWSDTNGSLSSTWKLGALTPLAHVGGPIRTNGTELGTITVSAGTYLIDANAMFNRGAAAATADPDTYPLVTVWQGDTWASDFSNTIGTWSGGRMSRATFIDTTASGTTVLTVPAGTTTTLHVVAFAYNEDRSSTGTVNAESASVAVQRVG